MKFISGSVEGFNWKCLDTESGLTYDTSASYPSGMSLRCAIDENAAHLRLVVYSLLGPEDSNEIVYYDAQAKAIIAWLETQENIKI